MEGKFVRASLWGGAFSLLLLCATPYVRAGAPTDPVQAVNAMLEAARKNDVEAFLSGLTADSRKALVASYAQQDATRQMERDFRDALDKRFGSGAPILETPPDTLGTAMARLTTATVVDQKPRSDGSAEVRVDTPVVAEGGERSMRTDTLVVRNEGGSWKLFLGFNTDEADASGRKAAAERVIKDVREGKYQDRFSAMLALANALASKEGSQP